MADLYAQVMTRLLAVLKTVEGIATVLDNQLPLSDSAMPALSLIDGEAESWEDDFRPGRPATAPQHMTARPIVVLTIGGEPGELRRLRKRFYGRVVKAVMGDAELVALTGTDPKGALRHLGSATGQRQGRQITGDMQIDFAFDYVLRPDEL